MVIRHFLHHPVVTRSTLAHFKDLKQVLHCHDPRLVVEDTAVCVEVNSWSCWGLKQHAKRMSRGQKMQTQIFG